MTKGEKYSVEELSETDSYILIDGIQCYMDTISSHHVADELNKLNNENNRLKEENEQLKQDVEKWKNKYANSETTVIYEYSTNIDEDLESLEKELKGDDGND